MGRERAPPVRMFTLPLTGVAMLRDTPALHARRAAPEPLPIGIIAG